MEEGMKTIGIGFRLRRAFTSGHGLSLLVLLLGLAGTYVVWNNVARGAARIRQAEFEFRVAEIIGRIKSRFQAHEQILRGTAGLFRASGNVSRTAFRTYAEELKLEHTYPGIQSIGYAVRVHAENLNSHIEQVRREGFPEYGIRPAGTRDTYTSLIYIEPFTGRNLRAFGIDMYTEPVRRAALEGARDRDLPAISGRVELAQETGVDVQSGFLMYLPVYQSGSSHTTLAERRAHIEGWVGASFRMKDLMQGVLGQETGELRDSLRLRIYDGPSTESLMYDSGSREGSASPAASITRAFHALHHIELAGRRWTLEVDSQPAFEDRLSDGRLPWIAGGGTAGSLLLALLVAQLVLRRARAEQVAADRSRELAERRRIEEALRASEEKFRDLARTDVLTGLRSTRAFREEAAILLGLASRSGAGSALGFFDLDDFKKINDVRGHAEGDRILEYVGATLAESTRSTDVSGRLGGDEFVVLLPDTRAESARLFFDRLHQRLTDLMRDHGWPVGVSMGVALFPTAPPNEGEALKYADSLMYRAKKSGKNRVVYAEFPANEKCAENRAPADLRATRS
jgi:diguanylate cyclase